MISIIQRNVLFLLCLIITAALVVSLVTIKAMIEKHSIEPYILRISEKSKIPVALKVDSVEKYVNANQAIVEYFAYQYVKAREAYHPQLYTYNYGTVVRAMSDAKIYRAFYKAKVVDQKTSPLLMIGSRGEVRVVVREITSEPQKSVITFRITNKIYIGNAFSSMKNYKVVIHYTFNTESLTYKDIPVNPLGLKIDGYEIFEEKVILN